MKLLGESNCLVFNELTEKEALSYFKQFGETYWNDNDDYICIPVQKLDWDEVFQLSVFFNNTNLSRVEFLIVLLDRVLLDAPAEETDKKEN